MVRIFLYLFLSKFISRVCSCWAVYFIIYYIKINFVYFTYLLVLRKKSYHSTGERKTDRRCAASTCLASFSLFYSNVCFFWRTGFYFPFLCVRLCLCHPRAMPLLAAKIDITPTISNTKTNRVSFFLAYHPRSRSDTRFSSLSSQCHYSSPLYFCALIDIMVHQAILYTITLLAFPIPSMWLTNSSFWVVCSNVTTSSSPRLLHIV